MMTARAGKPTLRIALVAPLWIRVPPETYGGTELILHGLAEALVERGHDVTLFAAGDSQTSARLRDVCERNMFDAMAREEAYDYEPYVNAAVVEAIRDADSFDVIHCHVGMSQLPLGLLSSTPIVFTLHTPLSIDDQWALSRYPEVPVSAISQYQAARVPACRGQATRVIQHGIEFDRYQPSFEPGEYLAFLGRMGRQKSPLDAIRIAKTTGMPIVLAGKPQNHSEEIYFREQIVPLIDGRNVTYVGAVNHEQKNALLRQASALLFPIQAGEAFGLAMIEAMACGTPVVATDMASVSEIVDFGQTGYYSDSTEKLSALVPRALSLDRKAVREQAQRRFSHERMVDGYLDLYRSLVKSDSDECNGDCAASR